MDMTITDPITKTSAEAKFAAIAAKVGTLPREERYRLAVELALECGDNPTDEQVFEFSKLSCPNLNVIL